MPTRLASGSEMKARENRNDDNWLLRCNEVSDYRTKNKERLS